MTSPGGIIEDTEHGHNAIAGAVGAPDVAACGPDVVDGQANAARTLGDGSALLQRVVDALHDSRHSLDGSYKTMRAWPSAPCGFFADSDVRLD